MYLFWRHLAQSFDLPHDIIQYTAIHFFIPFVQAKEERVKIEECYNEYFDNNDKAMKQWQNSQPISVILFLEDESLILDTRIIDGRIDKLVRMINLFVDNVTPRILYILKKGLIMNNITAFEILHMIGGLDHGIETKTFINHITEKTRLTSILGSVDVSPELLQKLVLFCLEVGIIDDCLTQLMTICWSFEKSLQKVIKHECIMSEDKRLNLILYEKRMMGGSNSESLNG